MRRKDVKIGMELYAWTSTWGRFRIRVTEVTNDKPSRIKGTVIERYDTRGADTNHLNVDLTGKIIDVGIINVSIKPFVP